MAYLKIIETSQTWVCPKEGDYKIICVAGGQGGKLTRANYTTTVTPQGDGGATSFGSFLTVSGYGSYGGSNNSGSGIGGGGGGGYTLLEYGGCGASVFSSFVTSPTINGGSAGKNGSKFGGGGFGSGDDGGDGGMLLSTIQHFIAGNSVPCVIGKGGAGESKSFSSTTASANNGNDGVIVIQEV